MARQEFTIGSPQVNTSAEVSWNTNVLNQVVPTEFLSTDADWYLARFRLLFVSSNINLQFNLDTAIDASLGSGSGQEMSEAWEVSATAIGIEAGGLSVEIRGPNHPSTSASDSTEPYGWRPGLFDSYNQTLVNFFNDYRNLTDAQRDSTVLILDDDAGPINRDASALFTAGTPTVASTADVQAPPEITNTQIISTPQATGNTYGYGEIIQFQVTYNDDVEVTGVPRVRMNLGQSPSGEPEYLTYDSDRSDARNLVFTWRVQLTDLDTNGIFFYGGRTSGEENIDLNGGTIRKTGTSINAVVGPTIVGGTQSGHRVNGSLVTERDASALFEAGSPSVIVTADTQEVNVDASALFTAGTPTVSSSVGIANIEIRDGPVEASAGIPNVSATAQAIDINRNASATATGGSPSVSISAASTTTPDRDAIVEIGSGNPTVSSTAEKDGVLGQRFSLGDSGSVPNLSDILFWGGLSLPIDSYLVEGNEDSNLGIFAFGRTLLGDAIVVQTFTGSDSTNAAGPNLTSAWEVYDRAVTIIAGDWSITLPGPTHSTALSTDDEEPYSWRDTSIGSYIPFVNQYKALSQEDRDNTVLVLHDGSEPVVIVNADASATATAGSPQVSSTAQAESTFGIANFIQPENTTISFLALLEASGPGTATIYANSSRGGTDTPIEGNLALGPDNTVISRIRNNNGVMLLNDNDQPLPLVLRDYFGPGGEGVGGTFYLQTPDGTETSLPVTTDSTASLGGGFANFIMPTAFRNHIESISAGERYLFAFVFPDVITDRNASALFEAGSPTVNSIAQAIDINRDASATATAGSPSVSVSAAIGIVDIQDASVIATAGTPTVSSIAQAIDINRDASVLFEAGSPTVISEAAIGSIVIKDTGMIISSGNPTVIATAQAVDINKDVSVTITAGAPQVISQSAVGIIVVRNAIAGVGSGNPTVTSTAEGVDINNDASATITGGNPSAIVTAITMIPVVGDASAQAAAGFPSVTALPQAIDINNDASATMEAGLPTVTSTAESIDINNDITALFEAGLPTVTSTVQAESTFGIDDFTQPPSTDVVFLAAIEASGPGTGTLYADSNRGGTDTPIEGELGLGDTETLITRIRNNNGVLLLNDNDVPDSIDLNIYFNDVGQSGTFYLQTSDGTVSTFPVVGNTGNLGGSFANFILPAAFRSHLESISVGDRFLFAFLTPTVNQDAVATITSGIPNVIVTPQAIDINKNGGALVQAGLPSVTIIPVSDGSNDIIVLFEAGLPTVTSIAQAIDINNDASATIEAGLPTVTSIARATLIPNRDASALFEAGSPAISGTANAEIRMELGSDDSRRYIQELNLGPKPSGNDIEYNDISIRIHPRFISGGAVAYLRYLLISGSTGGISLRLASTPTGDSSSTGPQFTDAIENYVEAFDFENLDYTGEGINRQVVEPGPNHSTNRFRDATEPYLWTPPDDDLAFLAFNAATDDRIKLTLRDGTLSVVTQDIVQSINAGVPQVIATAGGEAIVHHEPTPQIEAGSPTVTVRAIATGVVHKDASATATAGTPTSDIHPISDRSINKDISVLFTAGVPSVSVTGSSATTEAIAVVQNMGSINFGDMVTIEGSVEEGGIPVPSGFSYNWTQISGPPVHIENPNAENLTFKTHYKEKSVTAVGTPIKGQFNIGDRGRVQVLDEGIDGVYKIQERIDQIDGSIGLSLIRDLDSAYITEEENLGLVPVDYLSVFEPQPVEGILFTEGISNNGRDISVSMTWTNPSRNDGTHLVAFINGSLVIEGSLLRGNSYTFPIPFTIGEVIKVELYGVLAGIIAEFPVTATHIVGSGNTLVAPAGMTPPIITYFNNYLTIELDVYANIDKLDIRSRSGFGRIDSDEEFNNLPQLGIRSVPLFQGSGKQRQTLTVPAWYIGANNSKVLLGGTHRIYIKPFGPGGEGKIVSGLVTIIRETGATQTVLQNTWEGTLENLIRFPDNNVEILVPISSKNAEDLTWDEWIASDAGTVFLDRLTTGVASYTTPYREIDNPESYKAHLFNVDVDIQDFLSNTVSDSFIWSVEYVNSSGVVVQGDDRIGSEEPLQIDSDMLRYRVKVSIDLTDTTHSWYIANFQAVITHLEMVEADGLGPGIDLNRGPNVYWNIQISSGEQTQLEAGQPILTTSSLISKANAATVGNNVRGDFVNFTRAGFAISYWWDGVGNWRVADNFIGAEVIAAVNLSAVVGNFSDLNVEGAISARFIDANVQTFVPVWANSTPARVHGTSSSNIVTFNINPGINNLLPEYSTHNEAGPIVADEIIGSASPSNNSGQGNVAYTSYSIPYSKLLVGTANSVPSGANSIVSVIGVSDSDSGGAFIWRNSDGTKLYMRATQSGTDDNIYITSIAALVYPSGIGNTSIGSDIGDTTPLTLPSVSTQNATVSTLFSVTLPAATGGTGNYTYTVTGRPSWLNFNAATRVLSGTPTASGSHSLVYDVNDGSDSTNNGFSLVVVASGGPQTITEYVYRRGTSAFSDPSGGTSTYNHTPTNWNRVNPGPTATEDVYRASRVASYSDTPSQSTFTSATAWDAESTPFQDRTGSGSIPSVPLNMNATITGNSFVGFTLSASWIPSSGATRYEWLLEDIGSTPPITTTLLISGSATTNSLSMSISNSVASTADRFSVRACNSNGCSDYTSDSNL